MNFLQLRSTIFLLLVMTMPVHAQVKKKPVSAHSVDSSLIIRKNLNDDQLLDLVQKQTFKYFWDFAHPVSGMARERSNESFNYGKEVVTIGGTGFGVMAI